MNAAIMPGWLLVLALVILTVALFFAFGVGNEHRETLRSMGLSNGHDHVRVLPNPYDQDLEALVPNERCTSCGLEIEQNHAACHGHQYCLPECPRCGGELEAI